MLHRHIGFAYLNEVGFHGLLRWTFAGDGYFLKGWASPLYSRAGAVGYAVGLVYTDLGTIFRFNDV